ncbi:HicB family protein [Labrys okinawensis]|uniref:HicB family protein n=1 Tax=Labrys okinawensis TaxID=346911 RepID=A0A2S9Q9N4_9HYPH|nr:type II toxin-antitoxin system HicB family antitoxin [Labrys okinawensis]PRH86004.1 HicB family protein [Labrys okinawensis]
MRALAYALIHEENGVYGISFPDFPGAVSGGGSAEEVITKGQQALALHVEGMVEDGEALPLLRELSELRVDPEFVEWSKDAVLALVPVDLPSKPVRINISIDEGLLDRIDRAAKARGETRSGYLASAAKVRLAG